MTADAAWSPVLPPVMEVSQTVWFEPLKTLRTLDLAELRVALRNEFPLLDEQPPIPGWSNESPAVSFLVPEARWPVAACLFANRDRTQRLLIQSDRLSLSWEFSLEAGESYPGFSALAGTLTKLYREFASTLASNSNPTPTIQRVELTYRNILTGIDVEDVALALLQDRKIEHTVTERERDAILISKHYCGSAELGFATVQVNARDAPENENSGSGSDDDDDVEASHSHESVGTVLDIFGFADVGEAQDFEENLRNVHDAIQERFIALTGWAEAEHGATQ